MQSYNHNPDYSLLISTTYNENFQTLCATVFKMIPDYNIAKDIVQEVFLKIWLKQIDFKNISNPYFYLNRAVKNHCLNYIRGKKECSYIGFENLDRYCCHPNKLEKKELEAQINKAIASLPQRCRQVFLLSRYEQKKYAAIAEELNISIKTVENHISRALKTLREQVLYN